MSMTNKTVLLVGKSPLHDELKELFGESGYRVVPEPVREAADGVRFAIEVTNYDLDLKRATIEKLDCELPPDVPILATSLAVTATEAASWARYPQRICGFGTFVPVAERGLLEIAPALQTAPAVVEQAVWLFESLGKETAVVEDEVGLVFPRILALIVNEAVFTVMEGTATPEDIDIAMKKGTNYPYGPLEWADRIGLDEVYAVIRGLHRDLAEERYRPAPLLRKLVLAGRVGVRSGQGFYSYQLAAAVR
ncbi:3-hydroxyacyl-CoA dehydrogenase family protein [Effusibacillus pohliae]|uniref:3-hydroxyacyl-CoA dehydrogenase family protein n=1 Tax=Effusibacillus pohliae TaxID=232270 RepID=UPI0004765459|nr:3-hydroxyacyl-CoA dehydrogenase family protein [Effusibacillus pohliae]